jgi:hypothetical protein
MNAENGMAKHILASLKSGVLFKGTVRSHSADGSMNIAWVTIELPVVGDRQVLVKYDQNLQPGQKVVIECVPNALKPKRYLFRVVKVLTSNPTVVSQSPMVPGLKTCVQRRGRNAVHRHGASRG